MHQDKAIEIVKNHIDWIKNQVCNSSNEDQLVEALEVVISNLEWYGEMMVKHDITL